MELKLWTKSEDRTAEQDANEKESQSPNVVADKGAQKGQGFPKRESEHSVRGRWVLFKQKGRLCVQTTWAGSPSFEIATGIARYGTSWFRGLGSCKTKSNPH